MQSKAGGYPTGVTDTAITLEDLNTQAAYMGLKQLTPNLMSGQKL